MLPATKPRLGGKARLRKKIISVLPEHTCYVEPFLKEQVGFVLQNSQVEHK